MRAAIAVAVGFALLAAGLVAVLGDGEQRLAGSNSRVVVSGLQLTVRPGGRRCQPGETVPGSTAALRVFASARGGRGGPLSVSVRAGGREVARGRTDGPFEDGPVRMTVERIDGELDGAVLCFRNRGARPLRLAGNLTPFSPGAKLNPASGNRGARGDLVRVDYLRAGRENWWSLAPSVARRFWLFKPFEGAWLLFAVLACSVIVMVAGTVVLLRQTPR
jgi:hypothetical protein